jgi:hypothetical protein
MSGTSKVSKDLFERYQKRPGDLIRDAVKDAFAADAKGVRIDMLNWAGFIDSGKTQCSVCFAGAFVASSVLSCYDVPGIRDACMREIYWVAEFLDTIRTQQLSPNLKFPTLQDGHHAGLLISELEWEWEDEGISVEPFAEVMREAAKILDETGAEFIYELDCIAAYYEMFEN